MLQQTLSRSVFAELASPLLFLSLQLLTYPLLQWLYSMFLIDAYAFLSDRFARDASNYNELSGAYARYDSSLEHNAVPGSLLDVRSVEANRYRTPPKSPAPARFDCLRWRMLLVFHWRGQSAGIAAGRPLRRGKQVHAVWTPSQSVMPKHRLFGACATCYPLCPAQAQLDRWLWRVLAISYLRSAEGLGWFFFSKASTGTFDGA